MIEVHVHFILADVHHFCVASISYFHCDFVLQLLYEFSKSCDRDIATTLSKNWTKVCKTLLSKSDSEEMDFADERSALQMIEKNVYHKKPAIALISFVIVSMHHFQVI